MFQNAQHFSSSTSFSPKKSMAQVFHFQDVSMRFENLDALKNVQLSIHKGEIIFVTGSSGAGKTTLLRLLSGELSPSTGRVLRANPKECFISQVFQDLRIELDKTCRDNLMASYDPSLYQSKKEFERDLQDLCRILGVTDRLDLKMRFANGGLKQKVAVIRSLLTKPDVFIADEPTSSLDADNAKKIFDVLNLYNVKRGLTVIWASHNRELVKSFTGRILHLDGGKLIYSGHACFI